LAELIDLSHTIVEGMVTYPGLPGPVFGDHLSREESRDHYAPGVEFHIGTIEMVANTGTYIDVPFHRFADGYGFEDLPLERVAGVPGVCVAATAQEIDAAVIEDLDVRGRAVLFATGWSQHWGTDEYGSPAHPFLTADACTALIDKGVVVVGIDSVNIDDTHGGERPAHTALLGAGIPIVEHLTGLDALVGKTFRFSAVPAKVSSLGSWPVRAFAEIE
jgi:kynurenine formamidase